MLVVSASSLEMVKTDPVRRYGAPDRVRTAPSEVVTEGVRVCGLPEGSIVTQSFTAARGRRAAVAGVRERRGGSKLESLIAGAPGSPIVELHGMCVKDSCDEDRGGPLRSTSGRCALESSTPGASPRNRARLYSAGVGMLLATGRRAYFQIAELLGGSIPPRAREVY